MHLTNILFEAQEYNLVALREESPFLPSPSILQEIA